MSINLTRLYHSIQQSIPPQDLSPTSTLPYGIKTDLKEIDKHKRKIHELETTGLVTHVDKVGELGIPIHDQPIPMQLRKQVKKKSMHPLKKQNEDRGRQTEMKRTSYSTQCFQDSSSKGTQYLAQVASFLSVLEQDEAN